MPRASSETNSTPTTAQRLSSIIKSCRDIMRKDKRLNGDLDRLRRALNTADGCNLQVRTS